MLVDSNFPTALVAIAILLVLLDRVRRLRAVAVVGNHPLHARLLAGRRRRGEPRRAVDQRGRRRSVSSWRSPCRCAAGSAGGRAACAAMGSATSSGRRRCCSRCRGSLRSSASSSTACRSSTGCSRPATTARAARRWRCITATITGSTACCCSSLRSCSRVRCRASACAALRLLLAAYLSLMAAYGLANMANDFWTEQIWKRGWTNWQFPDVLQPSLSVGWGLIVVAAAALLAMSIESPHSRMARLAQRRAR